MNANSNATRTPRQIVSVALRGLALAMGVAVVVLQTLGTLAPTTATSLLGLGLLALALESLQERPA